MIKFKAFLILVTILSYSFGDNFDLTKTYLGGTITLKQLITKFDTSIIATKAFMIKSTAINDTKSPDTLYGPMEFFFLADSLLEYYGRGNIAILSIIPSLSQVTDGWVSEEFSNIIQKYCDKYPEAFKNAMIHDNLHKFILPNYIFSVYPNWCGSKFYMHKSKYNDSLYILTPQYLLLEKDSCLEAIELIKKGN